MTSIKTSDDVLQHLVSRGKRYLQFHFVNLNGDLRGMDEDVFLIPKFAKNGVNVDGSSIPGCTTVNKSDIRLIPEWDSFASYTGASTDDEPSVERVLCTLGDFGAPHPGCARSIAKRAVQACRDAGFEPWMFGELEWIFLMPDGTPHDFGGYCSLPPDDKAAAIRRQIAQTMLESGCTVKRIHHECGPGQNEVELKLQPAMKNIDDCVTATSIIKAVARKYGIQATFMPKPRKGEAGNGFHQHFAFYDVQTGKNMFAGSGPGGLSEIGLQFVAGLLEHAEEITAVFARDPQSFARLEPGHEAPAIVAWGAANRTALVRIPDTNDAQDKRIEYRGGDASGSTHLMCAVLLQAGLDGIKRKLVPPNEATFNADKLTTEELAAKGLRRLPFSLDACNKILQNSTWLKSPEVLGEHVVRHLLDPTRGLKH